MLNKVRQMFHLKKMTAYVKTETKFWFFASGFMFAERTLQDKLVAQVNRNSFMEFFRDDDDDHMGSLSVEDRIEIFRTVMLGSSDFTERLLNDVLHDYCANHVVAMTKQRVSKELLTEMFETYLIDNAPNAETMAVAVRKHLWEIL